MVIFKTQKDRTKNYMYPPGSRSIDVETLEYISITCKPVDLHINDA